MLWLVAIIVIASLISFYRFPTDSERRHRWICFVSRQNPDGTPWKPVEGDRLCSEHFISKKKSDLPNNPDYVPSVYPETIAKKSGANVSSLARLNEHSGAQLQMKLSN